MKSTFLVWSFAALIMMSSGCANQEINKQGIHDYLDCVSAQAISMDDGRSNIGDISTAAVYACSKHENELFGTARTGPNAEAKLYLQKRAYAIAVRRISDQRKGMDARAQKSDRCVYTFIYESCHQVGKAKKSIEACEWIAKNINEDVKQTYSEPEKVAKLDSLCRNGCNDGILDIPVKNHDELCKAR